MLGNGVTGGASAVPVTVTGLTGVVDIDAGSQHTCAALANGTVHCWGRNSDGELGNGTNTSSNVPVQVSGITTAVAVTAGNTFSCAVLADGTARCWGYGQNGQLGNGMTGLAASSNVPVTVSGLTGAVDIDAGHSGGTTCAVRGDGTARCWGLNWSGKLGNGTNADSSVPVTVSGLTDAVAITTDYSHSCAVRGDGTARCWGSNWTGRLGTGSTSGGSIFTPVPVFGVP